MFFPSKNQAFNLKQVQFESNFKILSYLKIFNHKNINAGAE